MGLQQPEFRGRQEKVLVFRNSDDCPESEEQTSFTSLQSRLTRKRKSEEKFDGNVRVAIKRNLSQDSLQTPSELEVPRPLLSHSQETLASSLRMGFKFVRAETSLVRKILTSHGLREVAADSPNFNLLWTGVHVTSNTFKSLLPFQRINRFPRSSELTMKNKLCRNIRRMQQFRDARAFDIIPQSFLLPQERSDLVAAHNKSGGPWIAKPVASSRGRGIFIVDSPSLIAPDLQVIVSRYISNPLCVDGLKCDVRVYVLVTSFNPLIVYAYEEGLVRIATVRYDKSSASFWNPCIHLCNYSINKHHRDYVRSGSLKDENVGHKWALSALLRHLGDAGCNTEELMANIEDLIVKAVFSATQAVAIECQKVVPHDGNCFELFGFDILIDADLKPWLLEVNLSPSLGCDSPLDSKIKTSLLTDLLNLVGIPAARPAVQSHEVLPSLLTDGRESNFVKMAKSQFERKGGFVRIFPTHDSMQKYGRFLNSYSGIPASSDGFASGTYLLLILRNYNQVLHSLLFPNRDGYQSMSDRLKQYERPLQSSSAPRSWPRNDAHKAAVPSYVSALHRVVGLIEDGYELSTLQARRAFETYLELLLERLTQKPKQHHEELVLEFLRRVGALDLRNVTFSRGRRVRSVTSQLSLFVELYKTKTEHFKDTFDQQRMVPRAIFESFLDHASEVALGTVLGLHTNLTKFAPFIETWVERDADLIPPPVPFGTHGFLKALPHFIPKTEVMGNRDFLHHHK